MEPIQLWAAQNDKEDIGKWMVIHASDFNKVKKAYMKWKQRECEQCLCDKGYTMILNIAFRPEVVQEDGGMSVGLSLV
eukprot:scaffold64414_cov62-Attheya_sp.AAC.1